MSAKLKLLKKATILYVEDDILISSNFIENNEVFYKKIYVAHNGEEGLNLYKKYKKKINIIITDLNMPKLNGIDMISKIRDISHNIPIFIISAFGDKETLKKAINLGINGFIGKPVDMDTLLKNMERALVPIFYKKELKKKDILISQQSKFAIIGEMTANIAHQWRQPLNSIGVIMMKLEFDCENDSLTKESALDVANKTTSVIQHMSKTIDDFRNFFLPNKEKKEFKIKTNIQSVLALMIPLLYKNNIEIKIYGEQNISVFGYENELKQVLINIVNNAKDAIINNKKINKGLIKIKIKTNDKNLYLFISDNAGGVPEEIMHKIFEPYYTTKFKSQGTGLGLYMSKMIIEKSMHGNLVMKNNKKGAVFCIRLPIKIKNMIK